MVHLYYYSMESLEKNLFKKSNQITQGCREAKKIGGGGRQFASNIVRKKQNF